MSLRKLNYLLMHDILPFNFGMDYDGWVRLYNDGHSELVGSNPATWTAEEIEAVNRQAREETELCDRLMSLPDDEFYGEVKRLKGAGL